MSHKKQKIENKVWLDLAWNYFQQHAQQRISYFNFFVIFSTILLSGLIASFTKGTDARELICGGSGALLAFVAFIFLKIDERNKFLTQHSEYIIKEFESQYSMLPEKLMLFNQSDKKTEIVQNTNSGLFGHLSHGQAYKYIYVSFLIIGLMIIVLSIMSGTCLK